jgi:hypothetical protein
VFLVLDSGNGTAPFRVQKPMQALGVKVEKVDEELTQ